MANLKEIRGRIQSVKTTQQLTRAMKMVAAAKLRRAQDAILRLRPYANKMNEIISDVTAGMAEEIDSPYTKARPVQKVLVVVVTTNRGLCGGFNTNILKVANAHINQRYAAQLAAGNLEMMCVGKKGFEFFQRKKYNLVGGNNDLFAGLSFEKVAAVAESLMKGYAEGKWDKIDIVYNEFRNVVVSNRCVENFLPIAPTANDGQKDTPAASSAAGDFIFEPGKKEILASLIPQSLKMKFYKAVLDSNAAEQGARMTAMDSATENANELLRSLRLEYNRARQATITKEILEIVGGAEALASGG